MFYDTATSRQLNLFGEGQKVSDVELALIIDRAHRMRAVAIASLLQDAIDAVRRQYRIMTTRRTLQSLSDHMLRDIGVERDQIPALAKALARGKAPAAAAASINTTAAGAQVLDIAPRGKDDSQKELPLAA